MNRQAASDRQDDLLRPTFVHPDRGWLPSLSARLAQCRRLRRLRRGLLGRMSFATLESDVRDVVYLTWVVPVRAVEPFVPAGVGLVRRAYRHGHFGPTIAGWCRRLFPSPLQSNWRLYVQHLPDGIPRAPTVLFVRNVFDSPLYTLGTLLGSDALPSHLADEFLHATTDDGYRTRIDPGSGSAPALDSTVRRSTAKTLPPAFSPFFDHWDEAVRVLCAQDAAIAAVPDEARLAAAGISLPIDLSTVEPLEAMETPAVGFLATIGATGTPFAFAVPRVKFRVLWERLLPP